MTDPPADEITQLLHRWTGGDADALPRLVELVYPELRKIAASRLRGERSGHTLQATALVNEAYVRLLGRDDKKWEGRGHFFRAAAEAMRKILIDHARSRNAQKRGGGKAALSISNVADAAAQDSAGFLALDEAIERLVRVDPVAGEIVRLKFFAGLPDEAVADALGISDRTVRREWAFARGWLREALEQSES
mgnify:CR=1 FL=1